jgi:hypothetical protein
MTTTQVKIEIHVEEFCDLEKGGIETKSPLTSKEVDSWRVKGAKATRQFKDDELKKLTSNQLIAALNKLK